MSCLIKGTQIYPPIRNIKPPIKIINSFETDANSVIIKHIQNTIKKPETQNIPNNTANTTSHWLKYPSFIFFFLANFYSFLFYNVFAPAATPLQQIYNLSNAHVLFTSTAFLLGTFFSALLVFWTSKLLHTEAIVKLGCFLNIFGSALWLLVQFNFTFIYFGQFLMGLSICCFLGNHLEICGNWFRPDTSRMLSFFLTLGVMLAIGLSDSVILLFFKKTNFGLYELSKVDFEFFLLVSAISVFIVNFLCCVFFREKPPSK